LIRGDPGVLLPDATRSNISIEWTRYKTRASHAGRYQILRVLFSCLVPFEI
jgi:hypothetical protein